MISDKEKQIRDSLTNKEYREALAIEHVNTTLAIQIRKMRESRGWYQDDLADKLDKHQETISQWENPDYGRHTITTLKFLAAAFDVALLVKFIPFSELVRDMVNLSEIRLSPPSFSEERNRVQPLFWIDANLIAGVGDMDIYEPPVQTQIPSISTANTTVPEKMPEKELAHVS